MVSSKELKARVSQVYAEKIRDDSPCCGDASSEAIYPLGVLDDLPEGVASFGCGNPVALASLKPGQVVLDLGSGAGLDCFLASEVVGSTGWVIGVDFTPAMLEQAREEPGEVGHRQREFSTGRYRSAAIGRRRAWTW